MTSPPNWADNSWSYWGGTGWSVSNVNLGIWSGIWSTSDSSSWSFAWSTWASNGSANVFNSSVDQATKNKILHDTNRGSSESWYTWNSWGYLGTARYTCTDGGFEGLWNSAGNAINGVKVYYCTCCADECNSELTCKFFSKSSHFQSCSLLISVMLLITMALVVEF